MSNPIWWQPWTWHWNSLLQTNKGLEEDNELLKLMLMDADMLLKGINNTLTYNIQQKEAIRQEAINILAAITLQHNGKVIIKPDFLQLAITQSLNVTRQDDGTLIIIVHKIDEPPTEPTEPQEPFIEDEE